MTKFVNTIDIDWEKNLGVELHGLKKVQNFIGRKAVPHNIFRIRQVAEDYWKSLGADYQCLTTQFDLKENKLSISLVQHPKDPFIEYRDAKDIGVPLDPNFECMGHNE